ncbi:hypothetical protein PROVRETT_08521 [Providencia rettgeri DSM 1131]|nr:hypothetical protein PROVRETT_08521 [Providencia rettgeri DSM 1131]
MKLITVFKTDENPINIDLVLFGIFRELFINILMSNLFAIY